MRPLGPPRWPGLLRMGAPSPKANEPVQRNAEPLGGQEAPLRRFAERTPGGP
jgi:hypothetical protein